MEVTAQLQAAKKEVTDRQHENDKLLDAKSEEVN